MPRDPPQNFLPFSFFFFFFFKAVSRLVTVTGIAKSWYLALISALTSEFVQVKEKSWIF